MHSKQQSGLTGFSLVEMMVVTAVLSIFVTIATSSIIELSRSSTSLINYQDMNSQSRMMLEMLARDLRAAVTVHSASDTEIIVDSITSNGSQQTVRYSYSENAGLLYRKVNSGVREIAMEDLKAFDMSFYTFRGTETNNPLETKRVQVEAIMERSVLTTTNTNYIISAQFVLRNHSVSK